VSRAAAAAVLTVYLAGLTTVTIAAGAPELPPEPADVGVAPVTVTSSGAAGDLTLILELEATKRALRYARMRIRQRGQLIRRQRATIRRYARILARDSNISEAVHLACLTYRVSCVTLWRKALCETGGTLSPNARNRSSGAAGLFQFLPSTWRSTPFSRLSIWSPYANALAAGWMHAQGRGNEWACR
jgi:hypothetical protein